MNSLPIQNSPTAQLTRAGVSIWLDDLSRGRLNSGNLVDLIEQRSVVGVTTNPSIFQNAIADSTDYDQDLIEIAHEGLDTELAIFKLMAKDVRLACEVFEPIFDNTGGQDGRVSIEVSPKLAYDTDKTVAQARYLHEQVDHRGVYIKIPATEQGIGAIHQSIAQGINVNVIIIHQVPEHD